MKNIILRCHAAAYFTALYVHVTYTIHHINADSQELYSPICKRQEQVGSFAAAVVVVVRSTRTKLNTKSPRYTQYRVTV